jgi:hypothetical protein
MILLSVAAAAAPISARVQTRDGRVQIGKLTGRSSGMLNFQAGSGAVASIPDSQVNYIQFQISDDDEEQIKRLFDEGEYRKLAEPLNELLPEYLPYIDLPSNLSHKFLRWMVVSYWTGEYDRVMVLSDVLQKFPKEFKTQSRFYRGLAQLEKKDFQSLEKLLAGPDGDAVYPPQSAARLYIDARLLQNRKQYVPAIRTAAALMAEHSRDADWMPRAELLCAELYGQLDMPESKKAVLDDIHEFYSDPRIQKQAAAIAAKK